MCLAIPLAASTVIIRRSTRAGRDDESPRPASQTAADTVHARLRADVAAMQTFRPGYPFWRHVFTIPDGSIAFGSAVDGRLLATFPARGDWSRRAVWTDPAIALTLDGRSLARKLDERREQVALLMERAAGPVLHNSTRGDALLMNPPSYGQLLAEWGAIYERFGVPADIGLAQVIFESGLSGTRRSNANAVGFCQWQRKNWKRLGYFSSTTIQERNQTTQAPYCAAYLSVLATKYGSFIPALSEHNAGGTNVGRALIAGEYWAGGRPRPIPSRLAARPRPANASRQGLPTGLRSYGYPLASLRGDGLWQHVQRQPADRVDAANADSRHAHAARDYADRDRQAYGSHCRRGTPLRSGTRRSRARWSHALPSVLRQRVRCGRRVLAPAGQSCLTRPFSMNSCASSLAPNDGTIRAFAPVLADFKRRFRETNTEEGLVMETVLAYTMDQAYTSTRRSFPSTDSIATVTRFGG